MILVKQSLEWNVKREWLKRDGLCSLTLNKALLQAYDVWPQEFTTDLRWRLLQIFHVFNEKLEISFYILSTKIIKLNTGKNPKPQHTYRCFITKDLYSPFIENYIRISLIFKLGITIFLERWRQGTYTIGRHFIYLFSLPFCITECLSAVVLSLQT